MKKILTVFLALSMMTGSVLAADFDSNPLRQQFEAGLYESDGSFIAAGVVFEDDDSWIEGGADDPERVDGQRSLGRKSPVKAGLLSALVPGLGQIYNDQTYKAKYFLAAEALTWVSFIGFRMYGDWREDDAIEYANTAANANLSEDDGDLLDWVGFYIDTDEYNSFGRVGDPERPFLPPDNPDYHWQWQSAEDQRVYRDLRNSSKEADRRSNFVLGLAGGLNRVLATIEAVYSANKINRSVGEAWEFGGIEYKLEIDPFSRDRQFGLTVYPGF